MFLEDDYNQYRVKKNTHCLITFKLSLFTPPKKFICTNTNRHRFLIGLLRCLGAGHSPRSSPSRTFWLVKFTTNYSPLRMNLFLQPFSSYFFRIVNLNLENKNKYSMSIESNSGNNFMLASDTSPIWLSKPNNVILHFRSRGQLNSI